MSDPRDLDVQKNLTGVREALLEVMDKLRLSIEDFRRVWEPIEEFIGGLTWEEVQLVFPEADKAELWKVWEAAVDKYEEGTDGTD